LYSAGKERLIHEKMHPAEVVLAVAQPNLDVLEKANCTVESLNKALADLSLKTSELEKNLAVSEVLVQKAAASLDRLDEIHTRIMLLLESTILEFKVKTVE
jgi:hypothetical protein